MQCLVCYLEDREVRIFKLFFCWSLSLVLFLFWLYNLCFLYSNTSKLYKKLNCGSLMIIYDTGIYSTHVTESPMRPFVAACGASLATSLLSWAWPIRNEPAWQCQTSVLNSWGALVETQCLPCKAFRQGRKKKEKVFQMSHEWGH